MSEGYDYRVDDVACDMIEEQQNAA